MIEKYFQTIHEIITAGHWITHVVGKEVKAYGVTEPQYNVLRTLKEARGKPVSVHAILSKMVQQNSNVTRIIDKLLAKGYVTRTECPTNRRKMDISITNEGMAMLRRLDRRVLKLHEPLMDNLNETELEQLRTLINKLNLSKHE